MSAKNFHQLASTKKTQADISSNSLKQKITPTSVDRKIVSTHVDWKNHQSTSREKTLDNIDQKILFFF